MPGACEAHQAQALGAAEVQCMVASEPADALRWKALVDQAPFADAYHRPAYARACEIAGGGKALGLVLATGRQQVLLPLLLRPLSELPFAGGEHGFDSATPYGYGGLLAVGLRERPAKSDVRALLRALRTWCRHSGVVSCFVRLHPLLEQDCWLGGARESEAWWSVRHRGSTVVLDLQKWDAATQRLAGMRRDRRLDLNHARRCLRVTWSGADLPLKESLARFQMIYDGRMTQLGAGAHYFFPAAYYSALANDLSQNLGVALAWRDHRLVASSLFFGQGPFAHYHLSAANDEGRQDGAPTLLINAGAQWARERGHRYLHLGGGVRPADSLFEYKLSFGGVVHPYYTLQVVADQSRYLRLVERRRECQSLPDPRDGYFPQYRA